VQEEAARWAHEVAAKQRGNEKRHEHGVAQDALGIVERSHILELHTLRNLVLHDGALEKGNVLRAFTIERRRVA
jgi:hypothetical protein